MKILKTISILSVAVITGCTQVDTGTTAVKRSWGDVGKQTYTSQLVFYNPLSTDILTYNTKDQSKLYKSTPLQTQDQMTTHIDVRVQYNIIPTSIPMIASKIGNEKQLDDVVIDANFYSILRESAKNIKMVNDLFESTVQSKLQQDLTNKMRLALKDYGVNVKSVLISNIVLPSYLQDSIKASKVREQEIATQKAQLEKTKIDQQQKIVIAQAEAEAAKQKAIAIKELADANAYKIQVENKAISNSTTKYIQIQAIEALKEMSKDPSAKIYALGNNINNVLPILNMQGEKK
jgi:regulator of protease activity HflC (stomatin/prohibitin superfamily)